VIGWLRKESWDCEDKSIFLLSLLIYFGGLYKFFFFMGRQPQWDQGLLIVEVSRSHSAGHTTVGRSPLDGWSARRREFRLTTHNTHNKQISIPPVGFETAVPANERPSSHALDRADIGIGCTRLTLKSLN